MSERTQARIGSIVGALALAAVLGRLIAAVAAHPERTTFLWWVVVIAVAAFALLIVTILWSKGWGK